MNNATNLFLTISFTIASLSPHISSPKKHDDTSIEQILCIEFRRIRNTNCKDYKEYVDDAWLNSIKPKARIHLMPMAMENANWTVTVLLYSVFVVGKEK